MPAEEAMSRLATLVASLCVASLVFIACSSDAPKADNASERDANLEAVPLTFLTHDSFAISEGVFEAFFNQTGIRVEVLTSGDVGSLVAQTILSADNPVGTPMVGIFAMYSNTNCHHFIFTCTHVCVVGTTPCY